MMKKNAFWLCGVLASAIFSASAHADVDINDLNSDEYAGIHIDIIPEEEEDDVDAPDYSFDYEPGSNAGSCDTVLCLGGMVMGKSGGSACKGPIKDFFNILKFKDGVFSPSRTVKSRTSFLNGCAGAPDSLKSDIIKSFGRLFSL